MHRINTYVTIILLALMITNIFSQSKEKTVYLLFDTSNNEKCKVAIDGKGYQLLNKFRKEKLREFTVFKICEEEFLFHKNSSVKDTCTIEFLQNIHIVNLKYLVDTYENAKPKQFKHHTFNKIYIIEKLSENKFIKYKVSWKDEMLMID